MKWTVGMKIALGFALVLAVFVIAGAMSYRGTGRLIEAMDARGDAARINTAGDEVRLALRGIGSNLRTYLITGEDAHLEQFRNALAQAQAAEGPVQKLQALVADVPEQARQARQVAELFRSYGSESTAIAETRRSKGLPAAAEALGSEGTRRLLAEFGRAIGEMDRMQADVLRRATEQAEREADAALWIIGLGTAAAFLLAALAGYWLTRNIAAPLNLLTQAAERMTLGHLGEPVAVAQRGDEIGVLMRALERMRLALRSLATNAEQISGGDLRAAVTPQSDADQLGTAFARMAGDLRAQLKALIEGAGVLGASASEIVASSSQLAASASQSAAAVAETTTTVEEVRQTAQLASQKARHVADSAQKAVQTTEGGRRATQDVEAGMVRIRSQMELIGSSMMRLSEQSQAVGQIIATVEDIATQSNLLAVNAAIEAAKAGEHGKGFAVVAQEVKSLAEQSRQATTQVRAILGDIQKATSGAVMATEEGGKAVESGIRQTEQAALAIQQLSASVNEAAQAATQIAASSQQQLVGVDQVAGAMDSIKQASAQNVVSATQLEATARGIDELGARLKALVGRYQV